VVTHLAGLLAQKESEPGDDLISRLITRNKEEGLVETHDILNLVRTLIAGAHETTANMIALGTIALIERPELVAELAADPSLWSRTVDELLRYFSISDAGTSRLALEDIEVGGVVIRAGEGVIASMLAANHDPEAFADPDKIDIHRPSNNHVSFGAGVHQCVGHALVRMQLEIVYRTLFTRIPGLRLTVPSDELPVKWDSIIHGVYELPVTW
jgi:cytochrome P450